MLAAGSRLGPYEIVAPLGAGGMGEVYRARDTRLGRDVAVKVLPPHLAETPEARARFDREARTISQLSHPHICTLHDIGRQDGIDYLVMELVDGETLARRLEKGALPVAEVLTLGRQIAQALDRAHRAGVVHRDLKPGNVMLTKGGAKLLDFGLARALGLAPTTDAMSQSPTMTGPLTAEGTIVGTFQYMSPEQLEGREADARSDLWALGCVLYEMTTGVRAFNGGSQASLIAAIMERQPPPLSSVQPVTPPQLERVVTRCLQKDPDARFQSAGDLAFALEHDGASATGAAAGRHALPAARPGRGRLVAIVALAAVVAGVLLGVAISRRLGTASVAKGADTQPVRRFDLVLPDSLPLTYVGDAMLGIELKALALSPRADVLVYVGGRRGQSRLVTVDLATGTTQALPGTEGAFCPFFSPDGAWIGFLVQTELKKIAVRGSAPVVLAAVEEPTGAQWLDAERIAVIERQGQVLTFVRASGGRLDSQKTSPRIGFAQMLSPDRTRLAWAASRQMATYEFASGTTSYLTINGLEPEGSLVPANLLYGLMPTLLPSGHLLYVQAGSGGTLVGVPVERKTLRPLADPIQVATNLRVSSTGILAQLSAADGVLVYAEDPGSGTLRFVRRGADGQDKALAFPPGDYGAFELSPDGNRLAVIKRPPSGQPELWIFDLERGTQERLHDAIYGLGNWSADGLALCVTAGGAGGSRPALRLRLGGAGGADTLAVGTVSAYRAVVESPDGRWLLRLSADGGVVVGRGDPGGQGIEIRDISPLSRFSPDGNWLAGTYSEGGRSEIYVCPSDQPTRRVRVSTAGGEEPHWGSDGKTIVYRFENSWYRSSFQPGPQPAVGLPERVLTGPYVNVPGYSHAVFPDGSQLLVLGSGGDGTRRLRVVTGVEGLFAGE
jgi:Tol biopolymer transport system component